MIRTPFKSLKGIQTTKGTEKFEDFRDEECDHEQPMSPLSRLFHEPGYNLYIIVVIGFKTRIDVEVMKANAIHLFNKNPRFSSLQVPDKESGNMKWVPCHVDVDNHVIVPEIDPNMELSDKFVEDYISNLSRSRIENSRPLWDLHILNTKTSDAQGTCVFRFHHSLGDGISLMALFLSFCRKTLDPEAYPTFPLGKVPNGHMKVTTFRSILMVLWNSIVAIMMFILTLLFLRDTQTPLKGSPGAGDRPRRFVRTSVNLDDIKMVKKAMDVTVNDVIIGVIQAGLYRYLHRIYGAEENNSSVPENIRLRAIIPFNMRDTSLLDDLSNTTVRRESGNKLGSVLLPLSIKQKDDPLDYVREAKKVMERKKASLEPLLKSFIAGMIIKLFGFKALLIHVVSYVDKVTFVVSVDEETIPDPKNLCDDLQHSFQQIKTSVLARGRGA